MNEIVYKLNGETLTPEEWRKRLAKRRKNKKSWLEGAPMTAHTYRDHDPLTSDGAGCMKSQVPEMREVIKKHNIKGVTVEDSGQLKITSRRGRKELLRARGLADADGMYGD